MALTQTHASVLLANGKQLDVVVTNADALRFEDTAAKHKWQWMTVSKDGTATVLRGQLKQTFEIWAALRRTNQYDGQWEDFADDCVALDTDEVDVDPTRPAPEAGS